MQTPTRKPFHLGGLLFIFYYTSVETGYGSLQKKRLAVFLDIISGVLILFLHGLH
jgi:hypothetical protein